MMDFSITPQTPYHIINYLIVNGDEEFWKLLYYNDVYALEHDNLTPEQKIKLIWTGQKVEDCNIFFTKLIEDFIPQSKVIMKMFTNQINPINAYTANVLMAIEFLWGGEMSVVYDNNRIPCNRGDLLLHYFMKCVNGKNIDKCGAISFDYGRNRFDCVKTIFGNELSFTGIALYLTLPISSNGKYSLDCIENRLEGNNYD